MNGYLVDTNAALISLMDPDRLPAGVRRAMLADPNVLSVICYWEVLLKTMKGNLRVGDPRMWWHDTLDRLAATPLPLRPDHVGELYHLPPIHKDPFDRILIAQASIEQLALVTLDDKIPQYATKRLRVIS